MLGVEVLCVEDNEGRRVDLEVITRLLAEGVAQLVVLTEIIHWGTQALKVM